MTAVLVASAGIAKAWLTTLGMMAAQGTLLVVLALALTRAGRLRPAWQAAIWLVVAAKLALPWSPGLPWSLSDLIARFSDGSSSAAVVLAPAAATAPHAAFTASMAGWLGLAAIWLAGALLVLARAIAAQHATLTAARTAPLAPPEARALLAAHPRVRLVIGADSIGPHVVGVLRPIIVVPPGLLGDAQLLRAALLHELAHVRRRDAIARYVQIVAGALMWWFPLVRIVQRRLDLAREAACDAWALEAGSLPRPAYARLLVRMAQLRAAAAPALAAHHSLDARVAAVLGPPARARIGWPHRIVLAGWFLVALGGARSASARGGEPACRYTPELAVQLYAAYPEADLDGDGVLSRDEACDLQAQLQNVSPRSTKDDAELHAMLAEPLCCHSSPEAVSCERPE